MKASTEDKVAVAVSAMGLGCLFLTIVGYIAFWAGVLYLAYLLVMYIIH